MATSNQNFTPSSARLQPHRESQNLFNYLNILCHIASELYIVKRFWKADMCVCQNQQQKNKMINYYKYDYNNYYYFIFSV